MKYISIDLETTGLDPQTCQILQIGAIIEDTNDVKPISELPTFNCVIEHPHYTGSAYAFNMNMNLIEIIAGMEKIPREERGDYRKKHNILTPQMVATAFANWAAFNGCEVDGDRVIINAAGKNFAAFDKVWLETLIPTWNTKVKIRNRIIDPAVLVTDWKNDQSLPGLGKCKERIGLENHVTHDGLDDAIDVVEVIRKATNNYQNANY